MSLPRIPVRIRSEGHSLNTEVINEDTGEKIPNISAICWICDAGSISRATVVFNYVGVDVAGVAIDAQQLVEDNARLRALVHFMMVHDDLITSTGYETMEDRNRAVEHLKSEVKWAANL